MNYHTILSIKQDKNSLHLYFCVFFEFREDDGEIRFNRTRGVDGTVVSYPGADGGEVGGSSRRERYSVPGTAPLGKRNVVSFHFTEISIFEITEIERPLYFVG